MILTDEQMQAIKIKYLYQNEFALRKTIDNLLETVADYKAKYQATADYIKNGRQS
jgi:hypothetical protein